MPRVVGTEGSPLVRAMVVDEDEIHRRGLAGSLAAEGAEILDAPGSATHTRPGVIIAGLHFVAARWDHLAGIDSLARMRWNLPAARTIALLDVMPHPLVRLRLVSAGVDEVVFRSEVRTATGLGELARGEWTGERPEPVDIELAAASVPAVADPAGVLALLRSEGLTEVFSGTEDGGALSRRGRINLRRRIAHAGNLTRRLTTTTGGRARDDSLPTWREVTGFVRAARGCGAACRCPISAVDAWAQGAGAPTRDAPPDEPGGLDPAQDGKVSERLGSGSRSTRRNTPTAGL